MPLDRLHFAERGSQPLVVVLAASASGMVVDRTWPIVPALWMTAGVAALALWFLTSRRAVEDSRRSRLASTCLLIGCAAVGGAWHHVQWRLFSADDLGHFASIEPQSVVVEGVLLDSPRTVGSAPAWSTGAGQQLRTRFSIEATSVRDGLEWRSVTGRADVQIDAPYSAAAAGDKVRLIARLSRSPPPLNPGEFDFASHYRAERTLCILRTADPGAVEVTGRASRFAVWSWPAVERAEAHRRLLEQLPDDQAGFAAALLLGLRDQMDTRDNWAFFRTGTVHILSISGLHIAMLALFLHWALRIGWLRQSTAVVVTLAVTVGYSLLIDAEPPAVRAAVVVVLVGLATLAGRRALSMNVLAASALIVLADNPNELFRAGPQLSFLAAAVLAWGSELRLRQEYADALAAEPLLGPPTWRERIVRRMKRWLRPLAVSTAIFIVTAPLVAFRFHILSPISLLLTPLLGPPVAVALLSGFLILTAGWLVPPIAPVLGFICGNCLRFIDFVVQRTQFLPGAAYWLPGPTASATVVFYVLAAICLMARSGSRLRFAAATLAVTWGAWSLIPSREFPPDTALRTTFISVGHGLSVLVEERDGTTWLYDCGRLGNDAAAARSIAGLLWSRGIARLDAIVISHGDADHYNGLPWLLEQFAVERLYASPTLLDSDSPAAWFVRDAAQQRGIQLSTVSPCEAAPWSRMPAGSCRILQPSDDMPHETDNAASLVVELQTAGRRILLTGDLELSGLSRLLSQPARQYDVVLAPHHGSSRSNPPGLADWSRPQFVIVSGTADREGEVRRAYEAVGAAVLETTEVGAVTVTIGDDGKLDVSTFRAIETSPTAAP